MDYHAPKSAAMRNAQRFLVLALARHPIDTLTLFRNHIDPIFTHDILQLLHFEDRGRSISIGATHWQMGPFLHATAKDSMVTFWRLRPFSGVSSSIQSVSLPGTEMQSADLEELMASLIAWQGVTRLDLSSNPLDITFGPIAHYFSLMPSLTSLSLAWAQKPAGKSIAWLVDPMTLPSLTELNLSFGKWTDSSLKELVSKLAENHTITRLHLQGNLMSVSTAQALCKALSLNRTISLLNISDCLPIAPASDDFASCLGALAFMLRNNFSISDIGLFTETGLQELTWLSKTENLIWLVNVLSEKFIAPFTATNASLDNISSQKAWMFLRKRVEALSSDHRDFKRQAVNAFDTLAYRLETNHSLTLARNTGSTIDMAAFKVVDHGSNNSHSKATMYFFRPPVFPFDSDLDELSPHESAIERLGELRSSQTPPPIEISTTPSGTPNALSPTGMSKLHGQDPDIARRMLTRSKSSIRFGILEELNKSAETRNLAVSSHQRAVSVPPARALETLQEESDGLRSSSQSKFGPAPPSLRASTVIEAAPSDAVSSASSTMSIDQVNSVAARRRLALESLPVARTIPFDCSSVPSNVIRLSLVGLDMSHVPDNLAQMCPQLLFLDLRANRIDRLPESTFKALTKLETLDLAHNNLDSVHCCLLGLNLRSISLHHNPLRLVPDEVYEEQSSPSASRRKFLETRLAIHLKVMRESSKTRSDPLSDLARNARNKALHCRMVMLGDAPVKEDINSLIRELRSLGNEIQSYKVSSPSTERVDRSGATKPRHRSKGDRRKPANDSDVKKDADKSRETTKSGEFGSSNFSSTLSLSYFQTHYQPKYSSRPQNSTMRPTTFPYARPMDPKSKEELLQQEWAINWMCYNFSEGVEAAPNLFMAQDMVYLVVINVNDWNKERVEFWVNMVYEFVGRSNSPSIYLVGTQVEKLPIKERTARLKEIMTHFKRVAENFQTHIGCFFIDSTIPSTAEAYPYLYGAVATGPTKDNGSPPIHNNSEPLVVSLPVLAAEISERVLLTLRCVKRWPQCLELISGRILEVSHTEPPAYYTLQNSSSGGNIAQSHGSGHTKESSGEKRDSKRRTTKQNLLPFFAITALIHHFGVSSADIMSFVTYLEENGTILYFGRPQLVWDAAHNSAPPTPARGLAPAPDANNARKAQSYVATPSALLENLAIINPLFCCQIFARLSALQGVAFSVGLVSTEDARKTWADNAQARKVARERSESPPPRATTPPISHPPVHIRLNSVFGSAEDITQALSPGAAQEIEDQLEFDQFWALLEVIGLAIRVKLPKQLNLPAPKLSDRMNLAKRHISDVVSFGHLSDASTLAMRLNTLDADSKAIVATRNRVQNLSKKSHPPSPSSLSEDLESLVSNPAPSSSRLAPNQPTKPGSAASEPPKEDSAATVYFVPFLLGSRPAEWKPLTDSAPKTSKREQERTRLKKSSASATPPDSPSSASKGKDKRSKLRLYRRVYTFSKLPFSLFGRLLSGMMTVPGCSMAHPYNDLDLGRGFDIRMGSEIAQFTLRNELYLIVDVLGKPNGALLFTAEQIIFDILEGWYHKESLGLIEWIGYCHEDTFYYDYKSRIVDAIDGTKKIEIPERTWKYVIMSQDAQTKRQDAVDDLWTTPSQEEPGSRSPFTSSRTPTTPVASLRVSPLDLVPDKMLRPWKEHQIRAGDLSTPTSDLLGKGAFGSVRLAIYQQTMPVAVKRFDPKSKKDLSLQLHSLKELQHEVSIMRRLGKHSNICEMKGWMLSPPTIVLEHLPGRLRVDGDEDSSGKTASSTRVLTLPSAYKNPWDRCGYTDAMLTTTGAHLVSESKSTLSSASSANGLRHINSSDEDRKWVDSLRTLLDVSLGMKHMHNRGVVHRDLFIYNVLLTSANPNSSNFEDPYAKIIDFGMARVDLNGETGHFATERWYIMPPELSNSNHFTTAGDVYSFSTLMYQLYTSRFMHSVKEQDIRKGTRPPLPTLPSWPEGRERLLTQVETAERYLREYYRQTDPAKKEERHAKAVNALSKADYTVSYKLHSLYLFQKLINECWSQEPQERPTFAVTAVRLSIIYALWTRTIPPPKILE